MKSFREFLYGMNPFRTRAENTGMPANQPCCMNCVHFSNSPEYLEGVYAGLNVMSSGYASVRKDDGICILHDLYLSASARCGHFSKDT